ncbi:MAG TPA: globin [Microscillaceae bacterium]|nr:globin [Microscillaceae bacterium]
MNKVDIQSRQEVSTLVRSFYAKVRQDTVIGHFFNETIQDWEEHLEKLTDFWETNLLFVKKYKGNPMREHLAVNQRFEPGINFEHFNRWLALWTTTVDELFEGELAETAKTRAANIATVIFRKIAVANALKN